MTGILFGQARFSSGCEVVEVISIKHHTATVRRTYKGQPFGDPIKRHVRKHGVKVHGVNIIRHDWMKK